MNVCRKRTDFPKCNLYLFDSTFCLFSVFKSVIKYSCIKKTSSVHLIKKSSVYDLGNYVKKLC